MPRPTAILLTTAKLAWVVFLLAIFVVSKMNAIAPATTDAGAVAPLAAAEVAPAAAPSRYTLGKRL